MDMLDQYDYQLPEELVAHEPVVPRDSARLFVYETETDQVSFHYVSDLPSLLPSSLIVYNDTKVEPARLQAVGAVGKPVELLVLVDQGFSEEGVVRSLVNRFTPLGEELVVGAYTFTVTQNTEKAMELQFSGSETQLHALLDEAGTTPLPPYIKSGASEQQTRTSYQTVFAKSDPSVAAPTASLHFTPQLLERLKAAGHTFAPVTLQVGLGTFAPVFADNFSQKKLHSEYYSIGKETARQVAAAKRERLPIVAVGTTVVRTVEAAKEPLMEGVGEVSATDMFIYPPHQFSVPDSLMTNFHVPRSSLMCLVDAFLQHKGAKRSLTELYEIAITERFRFYSYGDAMLIL